MKKISIAALFAAFTMPIVAQNSEPVVMTIGGKPVYKSEFESVFRKNNTKTTSDEKSVRDYADLFSLFKMKVFEAESMGLDTAQSFKNELAGYRRQLSAPYLTDKNTNDNLITEAYERMKHEVKASHILIRCADTEFPKDTLEAFTRATLIRNALIGKMPTAAQINDYDRLLKNSTEVKSALEKRDSGLYKAKLNSVKKLAEYCKAAGADKFPEVAPKTSDDPSVPDNKGDLGYFTALDMVYPFETAAYNTKPREISKRCENKIWLSYFKSL